MDFVVFLKKLGKLITITTESYVACKSSCIPFHQDDYELFFEVFAFGNKPNLLAYPCYNQ